jgi:hypothetical protein
MSFEGISRVAAKQTRSRSAWGRSADPVDAMGTEST